MIVSSGSGLSSMTIPVPNMIASSPSGGRYDFDDGGTYCGGWQDGKAHGHGVCTGPKKQGEYSGSWNFGFEMSGVYKWTNGAVYEGRWQNGKRHGVGVEYNGKWIYRGEWSQGFKGRYGVKASSNSAVRYEGTWANGLQDGYGSETYADGGYYQGQMCRGLRHGYGVRKSAPYGDSQLNNPNKNGSTGQTLSGTGLLGSTMIHSNSLQSANSVELDDDSPKPEDGFKPNIDRTLASKNGFVLVSKPLDVPMQQQQQQQQSSNLGAGSSASRFGGNTNTFGDTGARRSSLTNRLISTSARIPGSTQTASLLRGLRLRKQKSTSDLEAIGGHVRPAGGAASGRQSATSGGGKFSPSELDNLQASVPFTLSPEELDISDPTTVETYTGEWKQDKRNGHGICERSDGLKYEGQWHNDMKCGYGVTTFKDGTKEEGKYKNNILIVDSKVRRFFQFNSANIRQRLDEALKLASQAQGMALRKAEIADTRAATARDKADQASTAALEADRDSQIAFSVARQYREQQQQQLQQQQLQQQSIAGQPAGNFHHLQFGQDLMQPANQLSPLQMRRISSQQQPYNQLAESGSSSTFNNQMLPQAVDNANIEGANANQQQQRQFLGTVEPFNGRRGSFRGGSLGIGPMVGAFERPANLPGQQLRANSPMGAFNPGQVAQVNAAGSIGSYAINKTRSHSPSDPFNDLFDHYKSSPANRRGALSKQTSLDHQQARLRMAPGGESQQAQQLASASDRLRRFRMWSLDHAEDSQQRQRASQSPQLDQNQAANQHNSADLQQHLAADEQLVANNNSSQMERQFRHLVTSGEEMQLQQEQQVAPGAGQSSAPANEAGPTPTNSSYILPQSTGGSSYYGNPTPSPDNSNSFRPPSSQLPISYAGSLFQTQFQPQSHNQQQQQQFHHNLMRGDVHSLADEQLYLANRRAYERQLAEQRGEFANYDFAISTGPRLSHRLMRRTNSLSRNTPIRLSAELGQHSSSSTPINVGPANFGPQTALGNRQRSLSPASFLPPKSDQQQVLQVQLLQAANHKSQLNSALAGLGRLSPESAGSQAGLIRKPSLQVRYDPLELGGLMSREEVAALSHAQREQKRLQAELAERRATRPLLHLYLSLKDLIERHRLMISVLIINVFLMKLFADLIS